MNRPVIVVAKFDILENGSIIVAKGTVGTVLEADTPPTVGRFYVEFQGDDNPVTRWVVAEQLIWRDGFLGPLRAILLSQAIVVVDVDFVSLMSPLDLLINNNLTFDGSTIDMFTDDGYKIRISSNANNDLTVSYLSTNQA